MLFCFYTQFLLWCKVEKSLNLFLLCWLLKVNISFTVLTIIRTLGGNTGISLNQFIYSHICFLHKQMFTSAIKKLKPTVCFLKIKKMGTVSRFLNFSTGHFISKQIYILKIILKVSKCVRLPTFGWYLLSPSFLSQWNCLRARVSRGFLLL